jgi:hypothetical protein
MESKIDISRKIGISRLKNVLKKTPQFTNKCHICNMEFSDSERTKRHMIKAHSKPKREKEHH